MPPPPPPPSKPTSAIPTIPTSPKSLTAILTNDRNILHLLVYKSKNQHRSSLWFKWLQMLKRSIERITDHLTSTYPDDPESDSDSDSDSDPNSDPEQEKLTILINLLKKDKVFTILLQRLFIAIIPNSHRAFTTLITSTQYAAMGMVMLGCLARVHEVLSPFGDGIVEEEAGIDGIKDFKDTIPSISSNYGVGVEVEEEEGDGEDTGEVISRDSITIQKHQRIRKAETKEEGEEEEDEGTPIKRQKVEIHTTRRSITPLTVDERPPKKDSKKNRTAIDDLFADF
ncbi:hypothetical protein TWF718_003933 [Orbilia javanica]|uniref:RNase MRP protein 1 RNA binding domain-containing protein n=1 Tax=Orbilia javanica TaxID=47235 RepID=A0AAN8N5F6_9PEZI